MFPRRQQTESAGDGGSKGHLTRIGATCSVAEDIDDEEIQEVNSEEEIDGEESIKVGEAETDFEIGIQKKRPKSRRASSSYTAGNYCP